MEAPKEIYLEWHTLGDDKWRDWCITPKTNDDPIKYIRADLTELDWEDIQTLSRIIDEEECDWNVKVWEKQEVAEQVLHRFNEQKNK